MKRIQQLWTFFICFFLFSCSTARHDIVWTLLLEQAGQQPKEIVVLPADLSGKFSFVKEINGISVSIETVPKKGYTALKATARSAKTSATCFVSLKANYNN